MRYADRWTGAMWAWGLPSLTLLAVFFLGPTTVDPSSLVAVTVIVLLGVLMVTALGPASMPGTIPPSTGPPADERRLRGAFRRQSHPSAPGRPMPRAPGRSARMAALS